MDTNGKGALDYGEFLAVSLHLQRMANDEHLRRAFLFFDKDGNGYIEPEELREALVDDGAGDSMEVVNDILQEVDTDKVMIFLNTTILLVISFKTFFYLNNICFLFTAGWQD